MNIRVAGFTLLPVLLPATLPAMAQHGAMDHGEVVLCESDLACG